MSKISRRHLVFEVERVQTFRRRVATYTAFCSECSSDSDFVDLSELAQTFEVSVAEAVLQLRARGVYMLHSTEGSISVCTGSLLMRSDSECQLLMKSLPPGSDSDRSKMGSE